MYACMPNRTCTMLCRTSSLSRNCVAVAHIRRAILITTVTPSASAVYIARPSSTVCPPSAHLFQRCVLSTSSRLAHPHGVWPTKPCLTNKFSLSASPSSSSRDSSDAQNVGDKPDDSVSTTTVNGGDSQVVTRVRKTKLDLVEEISLPVRVYTELELVMMAWCEEHARQYAKLLLFIRLGIALLIFIVLITFYKTQIASERTLRGVQNMPADLHVGNVVYFDMTENGVPIGRIVIGLLTEQCPLYCEYFHRRCTNSGATGDASFRGMHLAALLPRHCLIFGDGREMTHEVPGFNPSFLPTEHLSEGAWRGALSTISYGRNKESPNFIIHVSSGDYKPQVFGLILGGYNVVERMNQAGSKHGNAPKKDYVIEECGELCTLAKSHITPMPWRLYETVSKGYDDERFGQRSPPELLKSSESYNSVASSSAPAVDDSSVGAEVRAMPAKAPAWYARFI